MPTRKQKRKTQKERRHEYETVWVDEEGNELEEPPEDLAPKPEKSNGTKPTANAKARPQRSGRPARVPPPPSWQRAAKRAALLGIVVFILFSFTASRSHAGWAAALLPALLYTALFIPFTYWIDRFAYNRYLQKQQQGGAAAKKQQPPKKR